MSIAKTNIKGIEITLYENLKNKNMIASSVYSMKVVHNDGATFAIELGDDKNGAYNYYINTIRENMDYQEWL